MWPRMKNSPHTYAHEGLESIFLFEFIELQWVQTDFLRLSDNNNKNKTTPDLSIVKRLGGSGGAKIRHLFGLCKDFWQIL